MYAQVLNCVDVWNMAEYILDIDTISHLCLHVLYQGTGKLPANINVIAYCRNMLLAEDLADRLDISRLTLIVFDECHHCDQRHPYNGSLLD